MSPDDGFVDWSILFQVDCSFTTRLDGINRLVFITNITRGNVEKSVGSKGRGDGDRRHVGYELPEEGPIETVGTSVASSYGDYLGPKRVLPDKRG